MSKRNYSPYFPQDEKKPDKDNFSLKGIKFPTSVKGKFNNKELYLTKDLAEDRAYNIGCSGYRRVLASAKGEYLYSPCSSSDDFKKIMGELKPSQRKREYYDFDPTDNIFDYRDSINDKTREGYNYKQEIFKRTMSNVIFRDPKKEGILKEIQRVVFALIETTKQIKNFFDYTVPRNNKRVF